MKSSFKSVIMLFIIFATFLKSESSDALAILSLYENQDSKDRVVAFVQSAIDDFLLKSEQEFAAEDVINSFFQMQDDVAFASYNEFKQWAKNQDKTVVLLYEKNDIACSILYEYLKQLQKKAELLKIVKIGIHTFLENVVHSECLQVDNDVTLYDLDIVPNVVMIHEGVFKQLSMKELLVELKDHVKRFIEE